MQLRLASDLRLGRAARLIRLAAAVQQLILPVVTLAALPAAYLARITRASMLEVLRQDYMRTARAKGLRHQHGALPPRHAQRPHPDPHRHRARSRRP